MEYLEPKQLQEAPDFYRNPTGVGSYKNMQNAVRSKNSQLILTTEYVDHESIASDSLTYTVVFKKLRHDYTIETVQYGQSGFGIAGVYIKGVVNWSNGTQSAFSTINNIFYNGRTITLIISAEGRTPVSARLRISELS